jgi:hypothetical protein
VRWLCQPDHRTDDDADQGESVTSAREHITYRHHEIAAETSEVLGGLAAVQHMREPAGMASAREGSTTTSSGN